MQLTILFSLLIAISIPEFFSKDSHPWKLCKDTKIFAKLKDFLFNNCDTEVCRYHAGENVTGRIVFIPYAASSSLKISMKAEIMHEEMELPGLEKDGCKSPKIHCPLKKGVKVTYLTSFIVPPVLFEIKSIATVEIFNEKDQHLVCMKFPFE
ncbi:hypothetical protein MXB_4782, partial [Myxobolus squamalis]